MKITIEANIPHIRGLLEHFGTVEYLPPEKITASAVLDTDALFVRTRTRCDKSLLEGSRVKFIATATIGTDHIDIPYCTAHGIKAVNAPGCNAPAVAQYVFAVIGMYLNGSPVKGLTLGVVGCGHVGSIVARWGERLGMEVMRCDPPRQRNEGGCFSSLEQIAREAEIITFHTPLTRTGADPTFHLADSSFFGQLQRCRLLLNSARGSIVDEAALAEALALRKLDDAAIDCWEGEPNINTGLIPKLFAATPHIAGYSAEGKARATAMAIAEFERFFGVEVKGKPIVAAPMEGADISSIGEVVSSYNPLDDTARLAASPSSFEALRNGYTLRHEVVCPRQ